MPKPILSDSLFNADDVATAILNKANLQIANENLQVVERTSIFSIDGSWSADIGAYSFMGFMFVHCFCAHSGTPANNTTILTLSDPAFYPIEDTVFPTISYQSDSASFIIARTSGVFSVIDPNNESNATYHATINGFYRYT